MSQAVLFIDESGRASIDAVALMDNAIELVMGSSDLSEIDPKSLPSHIERVHASLFGITAKLLERGMIGSGRVMEPAQAPPADALRSVSERTAGTEKAPVAQSPVSGDTVARVAPEPADKAPELPLAEVTPAVARAQPVPRPTPVKPKAKKTASVQEVLDLPPAPVAPAAPPKRRAKPKRRRSDTRPAAKARLPRRLSRIEDALRMDVIICLEDGKSVQDLGKHLEAIGVTREQYLRKWNLPDSYPMKAPSLIMKRGTEYEYDTVRKRMIRTV